MKSNVGANLYDDIARANETVQELHLNAAAFTVESDRLTDKDIVDIHEEMTVASRHDDDAVVQNILSRQCSDSLSKQRDDRIVGIAPI